MLRYMKTQGEVRGSFDEMLAEVSGADLGSTINSFHKAAAKRLAQSDITDLEAFGRDVVKGG